VTDFPYQYIDRSDDLEKAVGRLSAYPLIGVDIEGDSLYHYRDRVSLIQITGGTENFIIDPLALETVAPLERLFKDEKIIKVFHGADYDILSMRRDFNFQVVSVFDTALAARASGIKSFSLAHLVALFFNVNLVKKHQKADWSKRPLPPDQLEYACLDTAFLPGIYEKLLPEVEKRGRMDQMREECDILAGKVPVGREFSADSFLKIKGARDLGIEEQKILRELMSQRDVLAREKDRPPFKVISNEDLLHLAKKKPVNDAALDEAFPRKSSPVHRYPLLWIKAVADGKNALEPLPEKIRKKGTPPTPEQEMIFTRVKQWRDAQAVREDLEPAMIFSTDTVRAVSMKKLTCLEDLANAGVLRNWQIRRYGDEILSLLNQNAPVL